MKHYIDTVYRRIGCWRRPHTARGWAVLLGALLAGLLVLMLAWAVGLLAILISFSMLLLTWLWALLVGLATQLGILSLISWLSIQIAALSAWFMGTWLGTLLAPVLNWLLPMVSKLGPWVTLSKWGRSLWRWVHGLQRQAKQQAETLLALPDAHTHPNPGQPDPAQLGRTEQPAQTPTQPEK